MKVAEQLLAVQAAAAACQLALAAPVLLVAAQRAVAEEWVVQPAVPDAAHAAQLPAWQLEPGQQQPSGLQRQEGWVGRQEQQQLVLWGAAAALLQPPLDTLLVQPGLQEACLHHQ